MTIAPISGSPLIFPGGSKPDFGNHWCILCNHSLLCSYLYLMSFLCCYHKAASFSLIISDLKRVVNYG